MDEALEDIADEGAEYGASLVLVDVEHDRVGTEEAADAEVDALDEAEELDEACEVISEPDSPTPHCACAFCITLLLSSRNMRDSWSRYPGHLLPTRMHCEHSGFTLSH